MSAEIMSEKRRDRVVREARLSCRKSLEGREFAAHHRHPTTGTLSMSTQQWMGIFFESGNKKAAKWEEWAPPFNCCAQDTVGFLTPLPLRLLGYWKPLPLPFTCRNALLTSKAFSIRCSPGSLGKWIYKLNLLATGLSCKSILSWIRKKSNIVLIFFYFQ